MNQPHRIIQHYPQGAVSFNITLKSQKFTKRERVGKQGVSSLLSVKDIQPAQEREARKSLRICLPFKAQP